MKTIKTQEIDGYTVITNVNGAGGFIDPVATQKVVAVKIQDSTTYIEIERLKSEMIKLAVAAKQAMRNAQRAKTATEKKPFWDEYQARQEDIKKIQANLYPLAQTLKREVSALTVEHAIYFGLPTCERYVEDDDAEIIANAMAEATTNNAVLAIVDDDTVEVVDYRGKRYHQKKDGKWITAEITRLGVEPAAGAIADSDLSEAQRAEIIEQAETDRIAALKSTDKEKEKNQVIAGLKSQAAQLKSEYEIEGDAEALTKAQAWYQEQVQVVELKYA